MWTKPIRIPRATTIPGRRRSTITSFSSASSSVILRPQRRLFHDYFVTHLPSSSLHPDSRSSVGPGHKLPRDKSIPHNVSDSDRSPAAMALLGTQREMAVVRIPLKSAKHHFGVTLSRGTRPYNEDAFQAGTIEIPAFAKRQPISLTTSTKDKPGGNTSDKATGDPQVFYFAVFDGHGGSECSDFLRERLHEYLEDAARKFELKSSLHKDGVTLKQDDAQPVQSYETSQSKKESLDAVKTDKSSDSKPTKIPDVGAGEKPPSASKDGEPPLDGVDSMTQSGNIQKAEDLERSLIISWKQLVGGYFKRFKPEFFSTSAGGKGHSLGQAGGEGVGVETVLTWSFLKADFDFVSAQVNKAEEDPVSSDRAINEQDILDRPSAVHKKIGGPKRFKGGSTASLAMISTASPAPYWGPSSHCTIVTAHVGDTRILLCETATGRAVPLTSNHHPSLPSEAERLRRYAATFVTDSFGEERITGLANTRAFGDMASKRVGVSAEPEIRRIELSPAEYSFMVMVSDGVSGPLSDQEIVDIVKEARTPEQASRDLVSFATETSRDADNATGLVVRLGGWERRSEGGLGSLGTKELRDWRKREAEDPRKGRR
ncbi:protein phosphatase-like protein 2c [Phyllosticta citriasiana]|uniref:Protein phosphatase-like protein 2c n=1 Tax=Phyllosticta citriasiana TaxID=595635 RepID=A0ABR1KNL1_9PEZI